MLFGAPLDRLARTVGRRLVLPALVIMGALSMGAAPAVPAPRELLNAEGVTALLEKRSPEFKGQ